MSSYCPKCDSTVSDGAKCTSCFCLFHFVCGGTTEAKFRKLAQDKKDSWKCFSCKGKVEDSVSSHHESSLIAEILATVKRTEQNVKSMKAEMNDLKVEIRDNNKAIEFCNGQITDMSEKMKTFESKIKKIDSHDDEIIILRNQIYSLKTNIEDQEQRARLSNVEIRNIPFIKNENLYTILQKISNSIDYNWENTDIEFISRISATKPNDAKIKPIVMKFYNKVKKDSFLSAFKKLKGITTKDVGIAGEPHKIFASDHLTKNNKALLKKTKTVAKEKGFQFVWVSDCKILVRRNNETASVIRIQNDEDLKKMT